ncbi:hypothetical protein [Actinoplanes sp. NPDC049681]|uniref:hypothetical protein n=1 Tax=Actinoplanes sp. NPDC049681 TaxID=3363905 RepID=UPI003799969A
MDPLVKNILWDGVEDFTGLWDVVFEVQRTEGFTQSSPEECREKAREVLELLLADGLIDLYTCGWPLDNEAAEVVLPEDRSAILRTDLSWTVEAETLVWFATTDKGLDFYGEETLPGGE